MKKILPVIAAAAMTVSAVTSSALTANCADTDNGYLLSFSFEDGDENWEGRGNASVAVSSSAALTGSRSLYCTGRDSAWNGASYKLGSNFTAGTAYSFSANVMYNGGVDGELFHFTMQYDIDGEAKYEKIASAELKKGEWTQLANTSFTIPAGAENVYIYVETEENSASSVIPNFYLDEVKVAEEGVIIKVPKFILGDVNSDECLNSLDIVSARQLLTASEKDAELVKLADVDKSTEFEINDVILLQEFLFGKISEFPDNSPEPPPEPIEEVTPFAYEKNKQFKAAPDSYFNTCSQQGKVTKETYNGIRGSKSLNVYTPYNYDPSKKYNIFYLMHGGSENENTLFFQNDTMIQNLLDHMIMNGELEPLIVVTPTFNGNGSKAENFYEEFRESVIPFVEGKYSTYAESTSEDDIRASRMHRAYGGFSMGAVSTWAVFKNDLDLAGYFMPLSGDHWTNGDKAAEIAGAVDSGGYKKNQYFIFAATGSNDIAFKNENPQIEAMKKYDQFIYTSDFSEGNLYFLVANGYEHTWRQVRHYIYNALPYFFHETGK